MRTFNLSLVKLVGIVIVTIVVTTTVNILVLRSEGPKQITVSEESKSLVQGDLPDLTRNKRSLSEAIQKAQPEEPTEK